MRGFWRRAVGLLAAYSALGAVAACSDLLGIKDFTPAGSDGGTASSTDGSSSSGSEATSSSGSGSSGGSGSGSTSGSGSGSTSGSGSGSTSGSGSGGTSGSGSGSSASGSGSSGGSGSGSTSGSDSATTPVITFTGYTTADDSSAAQALSSTLGWEQSAGDLIVVLINYDLQLSLNQVSDLSGNAYTQFGSPVSDGQFYHETMYYCLSAKAAGANTNKITVILSGVARLGYFSVSVFGFTAPGYTWIQDQYINSNQSNVTAVNTGSVTTRYANEVLVAGSGVQHLATAGSGGGWVVEPMDGLGDRQEYQIVTSIQASIAATFTQAMSGVALSQLGTFAAVPSSPDGG
jgi:hypothetical protein